MSPIDSDDSSNKIQSGNKEQDSSSDSGSSDLRTLHEKACALVKLAEEGDIDEKLSKDWVQSKITQAVEHLTAIHDYIVHDKEATDTKEHGGDDKVGGDMGGGFIISIEKALK